MPTTATADDRSALSSTARITPSPEPFPAGPAPLGLQRHAARVELLGLQRHAGNRAVSHLMVQRIPYSPEGARARALEIDAEVRARPDMAPAELQRLLRERDELLPLVTEPPIAPSGPPAPTPAATTPASGGPARDPQTRWAPVDPTGIGGAMPVALGMVIVPVTSVPPPVPPSVLFPELMAVGTDTAVVAGTETAVVAGTEAAVVAAGTESALVSSTVPVVGWIVAGVIVVGVVSYLVYRHYASTATVAPPSNRPDRVEAPGAPGAGPVSAPGAPSSGPVSAPPPAGGGPVSVPGPVGPSGPVSLPGAERAPGPLLASSPDVERDHGRLDQLERSGSVLRDVGNLRERLGAADAATRTAAQAELRQLEKEAADYDAIRRGEDPSAVSSQPFTAQNAFDALMDRYPPPLNTDPYNAWPRTRYRLVRLQPENLSDTPTEEKRILVIRAPNGDELRFSVVFREGQFQDIHESGGASGRQR